MVIPILCATPVHQLSTMTWVRDLVLFLYSHQNNGDSNNANDDDTVMFYRRIW